MNTVLYYLTFIFTVLNSCEEKISDEDSITKIVYIDSTLTDCEGLMPQKCMRIKEDPEEDWTYFYDDIKGFIYQEGYFYTLQVTVNEIKNPPADGSSLEYRLVKLISKEKRVSAVGNTENPNQPTPDVVIYEATSRGFYERIEVTSDSVKRTNNRDKKGFSAMDCPKDDWTAITSVLASVDLEDLDTMEAPSDKRLYDGAAHATLTIIARDIKYKSATFDHKNPPLALQPLVNKILSLAESID